MNVGQQGAIVSPTGEGIPIDLDQAWGRGGGRGQVMVGGGGSRVGPYLSLLLPHCPIPVTVGTPPQEEMGEALGA